MDNPEPGHLPRDHDRINRIIRALDSGDLDALVCTLPSNVLLVSGYWPVIGNAIAIVTRNGAVGVIAPEDEEEFARKSWADQIRIFHPASLDRITNTLDAVREPLCEVQASLNLGGAACLGYEGSRAFDPSSYASTFVYGSAIPSLLSSIFSRAKLADATGLIGHLRSVLTQRELALLRKAASIAQDAFLKAVPQIDLGLREFEIAALIRSALVKFDNERCDGFAFCMSGPNSAQAYAAFQQTRSRPIERGDFVLAHCNSYCGGFWTDITRTFSVVRPDAQQREITEAVLAASRRAISTVRPGVRASDVDQAARRILEDRGFGKEFKHATGHGVGFAAINHNALPRIHPASDEVLELGMVFNIEPAVYIDGKGGMRHCDIVAVTENGAELLTSFQNELEQLLLA
jgi:Xaa-Pro aminopeptidase